MFVDTSNPLWTTLSSIAEDEGLKLYDAELSGPTLRIYIDKAPAANSEAESSETPTERVNSGDCSRFCRRLMIFFAAEGAKFGVGTEPEIEVSSPGVNRGLRLPLHYAEAVGKRVRIVGTPASAESVEKSGAVIGELKSSLEDSVTLIEEKTNKEFVFPLRSIKRAHVDFKF